MFEKLRVEKLFANYKKYFFGLKLVKYLGHIIQAGSLRMDPDNVEAICTWPKLTTVKEL